MDPAQIERLAPLVENKPVAVTAVVFLLTSISLLALLTRSYQKRVTQSDAHKDEIKSILNAERERAVKQENVNHGLLEMIRLGAVAVRAGKPKRLKLPNGRMLVGYFLDDGGDADDALSPEAPTVSTLKPGVPNAE